MNVFGKNISNFESQVFNSAGDLGKHDLANQQLPFISSEMQKNYMRTSGNGGNINGLNINDIIRDEKLMNQFSKNEFPEFKVMTDGSIFFNPRRKVVSQIQSYAIKWFSLDSSLEFAHDHDYEFARLNMEGYLMKLRISRGFTNKGDIQIGGFEVDYVCSVNQIPIVEILETPNSNLSLPSPNEVITPQNKLKVSPYNPNQFPKLIAVFMNSEEFINKYLQDITID